MTKSILSQLSIIMTSSFDIVSPPRIRVGIRQVSGGPPRVRGGIRVSRGGIESGQMRGSAGGLEKLSARVSGLVKKPLDCTVYDVLQRSREPHKGYLHLLIELIISTNGCNMFQRIHHIFLYT